MHLLQLCFRLLAALGAFALLVAVLVLLGALAMRAIHKNRPGLLRISRVGGLMLASAFLGFQKIAHPHVRHAIVQVAEDRDDSGDDRVPRGSHLDRQ